MASILACWWLLHWTKGISDREDDDDVHDTGHTWDNDIRELNPAECQLNAYCNPKGHMLANGWLFQRGDDIFFQLLEVSLRG